MKYIYLYAISVHLMKALALVTVVVGSPDPSQAVTVVTANKDVEEPRRVDFYLPNDGSTLSPGQPGWANYVKGVVQHYRGKQSLNGPAVCG